MYLKVLNMAVQKGKGMGKITLSISDKTEAELRRVAQERYGGIKGALSIIVETALREYFEKLEKKTV